ncbi:DNA-3-methyladenine glycosylase 2 family protein [bacterium]|nr:DNA-3-methyladenine glycosylase 2 family protein [bacterium]
MTIRRSFSAPFDFEKTTLYIGRYENAQSHAVTGESFCHVLSDEDGCYLVEIRVEGKDAVRAAVVKGRVSSSRMRAIEYFLEQTFGPDDELNAFYEFAKRDVMLDEWVNKFRGLRLVGVANLWECLSWSIIGQQVSVASAFATRSRLAHYCDAVVEWKHRIYEGFPPPEAILSLTEDEMRSCGLSRQKGEYLQGLAQEILSGYLCAYLSGSPSESRERLLKIRGIGPWSVEYAMMRVHGDPDACPYEDIGLRNAIAREYGLGRQATIEETKKITEDWRPFRSYGTFYAWFTLLWKSEAHPRKQLTGRK